MSERNNFHSTFPFLPVAWFLLVLATLFGTHFYRLTHHTGPLATPWSPWTPPTSQCPVGAEASSPLLGNCMHGTWGCVGKAAAGAVSGSLLMICILKHLSSLVFLVPYFCRNTIPSKPSCRCRWSCRRSVCKGWPAEEHSRWRLRIVQALMGAGSHAISKKSLKWFPSVERHTSLANIYLSYSGRKGMEGLALVPQLLLLFVCIVGSAL